MIFCWNILNPFQYMTRAPDKVRKMNFNQLYWCYFFTKSYVLPLVRSSRWDDSNNWSNIGFGEEITLVVSIEVTFTHLIWGSDHIQIFIRRSLPADLWKLDGLWQDFRLSPNGQLSICVLPSSPGGLEVERSLGVRIVAGSIPSRDIPKVFKRWYKQLPCLRSALKGECLEIWLVGPCQLIMWLGRVLLSNTCDRIVPVWQHYNLSRAGTVVKETLNPSTNKTKQTKPP